MHQKLKVSSELAKMLLSLMKSKQDESDFLVCAMYMTVSVSAGDVK